MRSLTPAVFDPVWCGFIGRSGLYGVMTIALFHHEPLVEGRVPEVVLVEQEVVNALRLTHGIARCQQRGILPWLLVVRQHLKPRLQQAAPLVVGSLGHGIEDDQSAASDPVAALQPLAVDPFEVRCSRSDIVRPLQCFQCYAEFAGDGERFAVSVVGRSGWRVNEHAPTIELRFRRPITALGWSKLQPSAADRAGRVGDHGRYSSRTSMQSFELRSMAKPSNTASSNWRT